MLGTRYRLPLPDCSRGLPSSRTSVLWSFGWHSSKVPDRTNGNASFLVLGGCRNLADGGGREGWRRGPSDVPHIEGRAKACLRMQKQRIGEGVSEGAAEPRNLQHAWAEGRSVSSRRRFRSRLKVQALSGRSLERGARVELAVWNYLGDLWSVDCNIGICQDILHRHMAFL